MRIEIKKSREKFWHWTLAKRRIHEYHHFNSRYSELCKSVEVPGALQLQLLEVLRKRASVARWNETSVSYGNENGRPRLLARGADRNRRNCRSSGGAAIKTDRKREGGEKGETTKGEEEGLGFSRWATWPIISTLNNRNRRTAKRV